MVMYMSSIDRVHRHDARWNTGLTQVDVDDEALQEAMRLSGARTKEETVNLALREYVRGHRRIAALEHFADLRERRIQDTPWRSGSGVSGGAPGLAAVQTPCRRLSVYFSIQLRDGDS